MSQIHQVQVKFDATEDRALLRIRTLDQNEYRFWLTRRFVKLLWPVLVQLMQANDHIQRQRDEIAKSAVLSFQHESALSESDFDTPFDDQPAATPLGDAPALLSKIQTKQNPDGTPVLCMHPKRGQGIELAMDSALLHSLSKLIADAVRVAQWDLACEVSNSPAPMPGVTRHN